jgi:hypothetical protein
MTAARAVLLVVAAGAACASGCAPKRLPAAEPGAPAAPYALYRAVLEEEGERSRRFRLLVFAEPPDRLHVEVLSPTGGTAWILDAGGGRVSVAVVRDKVAYVGGDVAEVFHRALGLPLTVRDLVGLLREGATAPAGLRTARRPPEDPSLPEWLELEQEGRRLTLERLGEVRLGSATQGLGSGAPPDGFDIRPIREMLEADRPAWLLEGA